jgi:DNA-binding beta-propeller fold protein YncE
VISHFSANGNLLGQFGTAGSAPDQLASASDIETDGARVYVADQSASRIKVWTKAGSFVGAFGTSGSGLGALRAPMGLDLTTAGRLYVTEFGGERVQEFAITA